MPKKDSEIPPFESEKQRAFGNRHHAATDTMYQPTSCSNRHHAAYLRENCGAVVGLVPFGKQLQCLARVRNAFAGGHRCRNATWSGSSRVVSAASWLASVVHSIARCIRISRSRNTETNPWSSSIIVEAIGAPCYREVQRDLQNEKQNTPVFGRALKPKRLRPRDNSTILNSFPCCVLKKSLGRLA